MPFAAVALSLAAHTFADNKPGEIHIAFGNDSQTAMSVVWQTATPTAAPTVQYGTSRSSLGKTAKATRSRYAYETKAIAEAKLTGLLAGTTYYYRVGDKTGGWSEVFSFRTAPRDPKEFTFTAFGDHGVGPVPVKITEDLQKEKPAFNLLLGDISYANGDQPIWDAYLQQIQPFASRVPFMPTIGNHENEEIKKDGKETKIGYVSYLARFALPQAESHYTFDYGAARFVAFNSDDFANPTELAWLKTTLAAARQNKRVKWLVVFQHHPPYGSSKKRGDNVDIIKSVVPIYDKYKVDLVLCGHNHHYERQFPLRAGVITDSGLTGYRRQAGTVYIVQGGGGRELYDFAETKPAMTACREMVNGYLRVTVRKSGPLTIEAKRLDRSLIERFEIKG
ncbi:MAG: purple acid phosphatase [Armatimonadetes bacterium]|nr:purple acid phosphatase [Armatimonadota bacterium]